MKSHIVYNMLTTIYIGNNCSAITEYRAQSLQIQKNLRSGEPPLKLRTVAFAARITTLQRQNDLFLHHRWWHLLWSCNHRASSRYQHYGERAYATWKYRNSYVSTVLKKTKACLRKRTPLNEPYRWFASILLTLPSWIKIDNCLTREG